MDHRAHNSFLDRRAGRRPGAPGFTLLEVLTGLAILALVSSSVLVVIDRCVASAANSSLRMEAFSLVRENLEQVLVRDSVDESIEYGTSDKYPDISWQTVVEAFPEPIGGQMWVRAVCSAEYEDSQGQAQKIELTHWIAKLTEQQAGELMNDEELAALETEQSLETAEEAAKYARVDVETIEEWIEAGLKTTEDDGFIKYNLDLFVQSKGNPAAEEKAEQVESVKELAMKLRTMQDDQGEGAEGSGKDPLTGLSSEELEKMDPGQVMDRLKKRQK
jgi:prepilin-type N-terminal cleavage/methylation domain-containing protein